MDEQIELWMDRIRKLAPVIEKAEYGLIVAAADRDWETD